MAWTRPNTANSSESSEGDELMLISDQGTLVRTRGDEVSVQGRNTQGVRVIRLKSGEQLVGVERIEEPQVEVEAAEQAEDIPVSQAASEDSSDDDSSTE